MAQDLLKLKKHLNKRRPKFVRTNKKVQKKISRSSWRKPTGLHNKIKDMIRGHGSMPNVGYRSPKALRNTDSFGRQLVRVSTMQELKALNKKQHTAIISGTLGTRKKLLLLQAASELGVAVHTIADPKTHAEKITEMRKQQQKARQDKTKQRLDKKEQKQKVKTEKQAKKKQPDTTVDESAQKQEDHKQEDKKELDKILTKEQK